MMQNSKLKTERNQQLNCLTFNYKCITNIANLSLFAIWKPSLTRLSLFATRPGIDEQEISDNSMIYRNQQIHLSLSKSLSHILLQSEFPQKHFPRTFSFPSSDKQNSIVNWKIPQSLENGQDFLSTLFTLYRFSVYYLAYMQDSPS